MLVTTPVVSTQIASIGYDQATGELVANFKNGGTYRYSGVPPSVYQTLMASPSIGSAFDKLIKKAGYQFIKQ